jgi:hypothetical protein
MLPHQGLLTNDVRRSKFQRCRQGRRRPRNCPMPRGLSRRGPSLYCAGVSGEVAEWLKALAWKACIRETVSWVRIPPSPPTSFPKRSPALSSALQRQAKVHCWGYRRAEAQHLISPASGQYCSLRALFLQSSVLLGKDTVLAKPRIIGASPGIRLTRFGETLAWPNG